MFILHIIICLRFHYQNIRVFFFLANMSHKYITIGLYCRSAFKVMTYNRNNTASVHSSFLQHDAGKHIHLISTSIRGVLPMSRYNNT